ncbi:hypothetical protein PRIPAC_84804 [Pristionchus pacificus]|uniref:Uncharacterized protein n=1 Tax=Pristionchus pacificus TaxID=54126 RepID=A0A2A6BTK2_PRIPA|nr:hypothetical protein PRIPAC_84804 [Pristionchus pacificus]|eukprot:PDM69136.1 hypothetical protein PRIPAC_47438 [Pristionchus pacificus]
MATVLLFDNWLSWDLYIDVSAAHNKCTFRLSDRNVSLLTDTDQGFHKNEFQVDVFCTKQLKQPIPSPDDCESCEDDSDDGVCYQVRFRSCLLTSRN